MTTHKPKHLDAMVSSTNEDLKEHREAVRNKIVEAGLFPIMMGTTATTSGNAISYSLEMVQKSELYIGIIGFRYGHVPKDPVRNPNNLSITELEYREAKRLGKPMLLFVMNDNHPITIQMIEQKGVKLGKLNKLRDEIVGNHIVSFFGSVKELEEKAYKSIMDAKPNL